MIKYLIDRLVFGAGLLAGLQVPKFVADYRQRVGGMLDQARQQLQQFQAIADRHHGGSLPALIDTHRASDNPTFRAEGQIVQNLIDRAHDLQATYDALAGSLGAQLRWLVTHFDSAIARATLDAYQPGLVLTVGAAVCALTAAFAGSLLVQGLARLLGRWWARRARRAPPPPSAQLPSRLVDRPEPVLSPIREPRPPGRQAPGAPRA